MNVLWLKYAVEVAKTGSINKAAENLFMGQPNLSRAIKDLEESLGIAIFERTSKGMNVTPKGEEFLQYARKILKQIDEVEDLYKNEKKVIQKFSISVPRASYISQAFSTFVKGVSRDVATEITYKETNSLKAIENILHADYHLGIIRYSANFDHYFKEMLDEKELYYELVTEFNYILIMNKNHPLANKENISYSDLRNYLEIAHADPYVPSLPLSTVRKSELPDDIDKRIFVFERASQFDLLATNPDTFMWVSPVPSELLDRYGLVQRKCLDNKKLYKDILIYKKDYHLTELDKSFITALCQAKRKNLF